MKVDIALRSFISTFRLPGEAQIIDRIIQRFSTRYFSENPEGYANQDSVYILAFAIIMLATVNLTI